MISPRSDPIRVCVVRARVGDDPTVLGSKGRLFVVTTGAARRCCVGAVCLVALFPTWSRMMEQPGLPGRGGGAAPDMAEVRARVTDPRGAVVSDVPWQVAWYCERTSLWLPPVVQEDPASASVPEQIAAIYLSPQVLRYGKGEKVDAWQRMFLGRSRPDGFSRALRLPAGGRLFLRETAG